MQDSKVTMTVRRPRGDVSVVDVRGEITAAAEQTLMEAYHAASSGPARAVILNFSDLEYMNSGGIGLLVTLLIRANRNHQKLLATGLSDHYREIFAVTRLNEAIHVYDTEDAALASAA